MTKCCLVHITNIHIIKWVAELSTIHLVGEEMYLKQQIKTLPTLSLVFSFDSFFLPFFYQKPLTPITATFFGYYFKKSIKSIFKCNNFLLNNT